MSRRRKDVLRELTAEEHHVPNQIARSQSEPASHVAPAKSLLAVAEGKTFGEAALAAAPRGLPKSNDAVSSLVGRFNREGLAALEPRHGGAAQTLYGPTEGDAHR